MSEPQAPEGEEFANRKTIKTDSVEKSELMHAYWRKNLLYLGILLSIWFTVSYGCAILFADELDNYRLPLLNGYKVGFWFGQQGSIYVFVVLIWVYVYLMNRLDKKFGVDEGED